MAEVVATVVPVVAGERLRMQGRMATLPAVGEVVAVRIHRW